MHHIQYNSSLKQDECLKILLISMISHVIPYTSDEDEVDGALNDPEKNKQVSYRHLAFIRHRDPARERADIPPGGACSWTSRKAGECGGLISGSRSTRRSYFPGDEINWGRKRKGRSSWRAGLEAKATIRWTVRAGCQSRPRFAVCSKHLTQTGNPALTLNL